jgi:xylulokinase
MEGIALSLYRNKLLLEEAGVVVDPRIRANGGSARSPLFRRILADTLNSTVEYSGDEQGSDHGAALLAGKATGMFENYQSPDSRNRIVETVQPDDSAHHRYAGIYQQIYSELYPRIKDIYPKLANRGTT